MRIFINQTNLIETSPAIDTVTGNIVDDLAITAKLYDAFNVIIPTSTIVLSHIAGGVYRGTMPLLATLVDKEVIQIEIIVLDGPTQVWYFKGPITSIIRNNL